MSANYKNWVPNGMITALTAGTAVLGVGTAALMCVNMDPKLKKAVVGTFGAGALVCGAMTAWSIYAHDKFSYPAEMMMSSSEDTSSPSITSYRSIFSLDLNILAV